MLLLQLHTAGMHSPAPEKVYLNATECLVTAAAIS